MENWGVLSCNAAAPSPAQSSGASEQGPPLIPAPTPAPAPSHSLHTSAPTPTPTHCTSNRALDDWTDWIFWHLTPAKAKPNNQVCRESLSGYKYAPTASVCQQVPASDSNTMPLLMKGVMGEAASHTSFH